MASTTFDRLRRIIAGVADMDEACVKPDSSFEEDLECDVFDMIGIAIDAEEEFVIKIAGKDADKWLTVQDAVTYIDGLLGAK